MQMDFMQFSRNNTYASIPGKLSEIHVHAWLFSNPYGNVLFFVGISWTPDLRVQLKYLESVNVSVVNVAVVALIFRKRRRVVRWREMKSEDGSFFLLYCVSPGLEQNHSNLIYLILKKKKYF